MTLLLVVLSMACVAVPVLGRAWYRHRQAWVSHEARVEWQDWWRERDHPTGWEHFDDHPDTA